MNLDEIFKKVHKNLEYILLILTGIGGTIPPGIPGMVVLAHFLVNKLDVKYKFYSSMIQNNIKHIRSILTKE